jgi:hypothetical protein
MHQGLQSDALVPGALPQSPRMTERQYAEGRDALGALLREYRSHHLPSAADGDWAAAGPRLGAFPLSKCWS